MGTRARPGASYRAARRNALAHHPMTWAPGCYFAGSRKARGQLTDALPRYVPYESRQVSAARRRARHGRTNVVTALRRLFAFLGRAA